jgi:hypothetical protein
MMVVVLLPGNTERLPAIKHTAVAHHAHPSQPGFLGQRDLAVECFRRSVISPGKKEDDFSRSLDGIAGIPANQSIRLLVQRKIFCDTHGVGLLNPLLWAFWRYSG